MSVFSRQVLFKVLSSFQSSSLLLSPFIFWVIISLYLLPLSPLSTRTPPTTSPLQDVFISFPSLLYLSLSYFANLSLSSLFSVIDPRYPSFLYLTRKLTPKILYSLSSILFVLPLFSFLFSRRVQGFSPDRYFAMRLYLSFVFSSDEFEEIAKIANKFLTFKFRITFDLPPYCSSFIHLFDTSTNLARATSR